MNSAVDLLIVGGGIHGCSAAVHAAMRGCSVVVVEKDTVGRHASGVNAGGVRRLGRHPAEIPIAHRSMQIWHDIGSLVDDDCGFQKAPQIKVAETEAELDVLRQRASEVEALGFDHEIILNRNQLRRYVPAIAEHCVGALACLDDGFAQPYQTTFAFQRKAEALGVRFHEKTAVQSVSRDGADWRIHCHGGTSHLARFILNCAGAWAGRFAAQLGEAAPVEPVAPMMIVTGRMPHFCDAVVGATGRPLSFKQMPNGTVVIGGARLGKAEPDVNASDIFFKELRFTAETAISIFPIMERGVIVRSWAGIEGTMPDRIPVIGRSSTFENAFHAFGFSTSGFQLGPAVGELMAELIVTGQTSAPIEPLSIRRFN